MRTENTAEEDAARTIKETTEEVRKSSGEAIKGRGSAEGSGKVAQEAPKKESAAAAIERNLRKSVIEQEACHAVRGSGEELGRSQELAEESRRR